MPMPARRPPPSPSSTRTAYRPFNLILADNTEAFWVRHAGASIDAAAIPPGLSMLTAHDLNDAAGSRRIGHFLPLFRAAPGARSRGRRLAGLAGAAGEPRALPPAPVPTMP